MATEPIRAIDAAQRGAEPLSAETKRRVRLADGQRKGFETAWNEYFDCYATTTYLEAPLIRLEDISYHLYLKKNINPTNPRWELPSFRQLKKILGLSQDKIQGIEARLGVAGLLLKESGKGKGARGENVANDYLLYEPLELADFLLAVTAGRLPGTLNEKGQRKLQELRERFGELRTTNDELRMSTAVAIETPPAKVKTVSTATANSSFVIRHSSLPTPAPEIGTPPVPENRTALVPLFGTPSVPEIAAPGVPESGTENRPPVTNDLKQTDQQQQRRGKEAAAGQPFAKKQRTVEAESVVVVGGQDVLVERGITVGVAGRLRRTVAAGVIARQVEIFDFLREQSPNDPKLTPGRLRRQIEEDWSAPVGFVPAAERAAHAARAAQREEMVEAQRRSAATEAERATEAAAQARRAELAAIGLTGADQATWARIAQMAPPLPPPFRDALFHAPVGEAHGALIFRDRAAWTRATGAAHSATRAQVLARVADLCGRPGAQVHYLIYEELLGMLGEG
ncbi:MAG TPA: hypothetical protein VIL85_22040 [Thermomicrobiales bacterium]|jgi:hypothetical protein